LSSLIPESQRITIGPSVLSADFLRLGDQLQEMANAGADYVHFDVMDGQFVPNISIGLPVLEATRAGTSLPIDVHLMMVEPDRWVIPFREAGADVVTFHVEAAVHAHRVAETIAASGAAVGVALNPGTPLAAVEELLPYVDQVLVMTVNPGFGGQSFIPTMIEKVARLRQILDEVNPAVVIQVDGGINNETVAGIVQAGATKLVAGTAILNDERSVAENLRSLREAAGVIAGR
jgi:ribulose-phosphate 3-epimerase